MRLTPKDTAGVPAVRRASVPLCAAPRSDRHDRRGIGSGEIVALYVTALIYIVFDLSVFHWLSGWLTALFELIEFAPLLAGAWFYWTTRARRRDGAPVLPRILYVPVISTLVQLQILLFAGVYHHLGMT